MYSQRWSSKKLCYPPCSICLNFSTVSVSLYLQVVSISNYSELISFSCDTIKIGINIPTSAAVKGIKINMVKENCFVVYWTSKRILCFISGI